MARGLKLEMVADGACQLKYLRSLNCPVIQGFYYSQAVPCGEARRLIENGVSLEGSQSLNSEKPSATKNNLEVAS